MIGKERDSEKDISDSVGTVRAVVVRGCEKGGYEKALQIIYERTERGQNQRITRREEMNMKKLFLILAAAVVLSPSAWAYSHYSS